MGIFDDVKYDSKDCACGMEDKVEVKIKDGSAVKVIYADKGSNLLDVLRHEKLSVQGICGGKGTCGKCKVKFADGTHGISEIDKKHLSDDEIKSGIRLACASNLNNSIEIELSGHLGAMNVMTEGYSIDYKLEPPVTKKYMELQAPSLEDQRSDIKRIADSLGIQNIDVDGSLMASIPAILREGDFKVTGTSYSNILLGLEAGDTTAALYGIAVDIGTTTVASYLVNMATGAVIDVESGVNAQRAFGADVISRINYTMENEKGLGTLKNAIVSQINAMVKSLCDRNRINSKNIYNMTVVGNTTMTHLFLDLPCKNIALSPYIPVITDTVDIHGRDIGIDINGYITVLPGISGYVGSDITAGITACGMDKLEGYSLLLDLGTNGEIALGNRDGIITCSTAAGPAFEGANIKWGIGGVKGAISKIDLSREKIFETIGNLKPCGICGSGVLDIVNQMLKYGIIDETGRMLDEDEVSCPDALKERLSLNGSMKEFIIDGDISFTQKDVREVQLASAAVSAGIKILLQEKGIMAYDVENVFIAGGFGNYMDIESALGIGLLPKDMADKVKSVGNSAGTGARLCLLSKSCRSGIGELVKGAGYIELSGRQDFQDYFVDSMMLGGGMA